MGGVGGFVQYVGLAEDTVSFTRRVYCIVSLERELEPGTDWLRAQIHDDVIPVSLLFLALTAMTFG